MSTSETIAPTPTRHVKHRTGAGARFNADSIGIYRAVNAGVLAAALAAVLISWQGLMFVGEWMELPAQLRWLVPVMIDIPIVVFTLATLSRRSRGESVWLLNLAAYLMTAISAFANFMHVASVRPVDTLEGAVGASLAALAPMLVLLTTEALGTLITKPPSDQSPRAKARKQAEAIAALQDEKKSLSKALRAAEKSVAEHADSPLPISPAEVREMWENMQAIARPLKTTVPSDEFAAAVGAFSDSNPPVSIVDTQQIATLGEQLGIAPQVDPAHDAAERMRREISVRQMVDTAS